MAAQTPADEPRLMKAESVDDRPNRAGVARKRVGARILRVVRLAMAGKIDCDQPEAFAEPAIKLPGKDARRRRIAVNEHDGRTFAGRLVDGNCAIRRVDPNRFHQPSHCTVKSHRRGRSRPRKLGVKCDPSGDVETRTVTPSGVPDATAALSCDECVIGAADCNRQSFPWDTAAKRIF